MMRYLIVVCLLVTLGGCTSLAKLKGDVVTSPAKPVLPQLTEDFSRSKLIAADFVATIRQIPETNPADTIFHTERPSTRFGELLLAALQEAGYDLRMGSDASDYWLDYNVVLDEQPSVSGNQVYTFIIAAGNVKLKRSYEVDDYGVKPAGSMFVRGASANNVVMDESIFSILKPATASEPVAASEPTIASVNRDEVQFESVPARKSFMKTGRDATQNVPADEDWKTQLKKGLAASVAALDSAGKTSSPGDYSEFTNMYDSRVSRYQDVFKDYDVVGSKILVFPNDSLILGNNNKAAVWQYANRFNPDTDVISVIGCSHGATKVVNGNAYLANGRAFRVKEEFLAAGFDTQKVLEEGCWASVDFPEMPARGVLVQHKRMIN